MGVQCAMVHGAKWYLIVNRKCAVSIVHASYTVTIAIPLFDIMVDSSFVTSRQNAWCAWQGLVAAYGRNPFVSWTEFETARVRLREIHSLPSSRRRMLNHGTSFPTEAGPRLLAQCAVSLEPDQ